MLELRCENILHGILVAPDVIEVKCRSSHCGAGPGVMVLHQIKFDFLAQTVSQLPDRKFRNPNMKGK